MRENRSARAMLRASGMAVLKSLLVVVAAVVVLWFVAAMFGINISLFWTLVLSVALTLALSMFTRPRTYRRWSR